MLTRCCTAVVAVLVVAGCGSSSHSAQPKPAPSRSTMPAKKSVTTRSGTVLRLGRVARARFRIDAEHQSLLSVRVAQVRRGRVGDLSQFTLGPSVRTSTVLYVKASVRNLGPADLGGHRLLLYAQVSPTLVIPPTSLGSPFPRCQDHAFPASFGKGKSLGLCEVFLLPRHGTATQIQWRRNGVVGWKVH